MQHIKLLLAALALARILAGETPGCPAAAKVSVANVAMNRIDAGISGGWFGDANPATIDVMIAWLAVNDRLPRLTSGLYAIGPGDLERMPWLDEEQIDMHFACSGTSVTIY